MTHIKFRFFYDRSNAMEPWSQILISTYRKHKGQFLYQEVLK